MSLADPLIPLVAPAEPAGAPLRMSGDVLRAVRAHAAAAYPDECCGALLGRAPLQGGAREVVRAVALPNAWRGRRGRRFLMPAATVRGVERQAAGEGLVVMGFYHSHPGGAPEPSATDREHAWPWYSYLIVAAGAGGAGEARSWRLADDRGAFLPEPIIVEEA